jgi:hypothetical protein
MKVEPQKKLLHNYAGQSLTRRRIYQLTTNVHMKVEPQKKLLHNYAGQSLTRIEERN